MKTFFFFFRDHHDFRTKLVFRLRISDNFFVISEMYHKIMIWANVAKFGQNFIAPQIFWAGTAMTLYILFISIQLKCTRTFSFFFFFFSV